VRLVAVANQVEEADAPDDDIDPHVPGEPGSQLADFARHFSLSPIRAASRWSGKENESS
jgi:hypothetical protein